MTMRIQTRALFCKLLICMQMCREIKMHLPATLLVIWKQISHLLPPVIDAHVASKRVEDAEFLI